MPLSKTSVRVPRSTYRLQFNSRFTFADAVAIVDYLHGFGISDCYASSYLAAVPGSAHGYDVADPTRLNPELGPEEDYWTWIRMLHDRDMGHVLDLVPNHMGIAKSSNPWWQDVLENGPSSRFAHFFDIEWHPVKDELADKVLIPILGDQYGAVLERQELQLAYNDGAFSVHYFDDVVPIAPDTFGSILTLDLDQWPGRPGGPDDPDAGELRSIIAASRQLPSRSSRDPVESASRAAGAEALKRRLEALVRNSAPVRALIGKSVERFNGVAGNARSFDLLDGLLNEQSYRLANWRVASEEINYRRFFDVNQLAALRMEDPRVFDEVHRFVFELVRQGAPTGLRVDHVDGLYAPADYLRRLQRRCGASQGAGTDAGAGGDQSFFVVVEKILGPDEQLPLDWPVHGTTGYEFAAVVNSLFVDRRHERAMDDIYTRFIRERRERLSFTDLVYLCKKQVMHLTMSGDINSLGHQLNRFSERNRHFRDFTLYSLISTLKEVIACFTIYRTYITDEEAISNHDRRFIVEAVEAAKRRAPAVSPVVFDFVRKLLLKENPVSTPEERDERSRFIGKFQQITGPVAAKGLEDTAFYIYDKLLSLNEVGGDPTRFGMEPTAVHQWMLRRQQRWPGALSATSTHDTKRGEDVRARLNVLSEIPGAWKAAVSKWRSLNRRFKVEAHGTPAPTLNEEYFLYQTLVGIWPFEVADDEAGEQLIQRTTEYATKALREAKVNTSWQSPDESYEKAVTQFIATILDRHRPNLFLREFLPFQARVAELAIYTSLAQLLIKITAPGVPDFYQGTELWDLSLVDPDNRRAVDYEMRRRLLASIVCNREPDRECMSAELLERRADGRVKMFVAHRALAARAHNRQVFERGDYVPLQTIGSRRESLFAFARRLDDTTIITAVPRLIASLVPGTAGPPLGHAVWTDTQIELPAGSPMQFRDAFTGATVGSTSENGRAVPAELLFERFPVALLIPV